MELLQALIVVHIVCHDLQHKHCVLKGRIEMIYPSIRATHLVAQSVSNGFDNLTVFFNVFLSLLVKQASHCIAWIFNRFFECLGNNHCISVVSLFSAFNYYRCITSPCLKWLGDQTLFVASIVDKQGARHSKSSIKMRTILQPGAILKILIAKRE